MAAMQRLRSSATRPQESAVDRNAALRRLAAAWKATPVWITIPFAMAAQVA